MPSRDAETRYLLNISIPNPVILAVWTLSGIFGARDDAVKTPRSLPDYMFTFWIVPFINPRIPKLPQCVTQTDVTSAVDEA